MSDGKRAHVGDGTAAPAGSTTKAIGELRDVLGAHAVVVDEEGRARYLDPFSLRAPERDLVVGAVQPRSVEQIQAVVRIANQYRIPLWTVSQGRNLGYGGASPRVAGSLVVDLSEMKRIIEIDDELCYAVVEPGVTFFELYEHIQAHNLKLWPSSPALGWGSVVCNTLDRGWGYTPLGAIPFS